mgnify:FL=1
MMISKTKNSQGEERYVEVASFHEMTEWHTDMDPKPEEKSTILQGFDMMRILKEVTAVCSGNV